MPSSYDTWLHNQVENYMEGYLTDNDIEIVESEECFLANIQNSIKEIEITEPNPFLVITNCLPEIKLDHSKYLSNEI